MAQEQKESIDSVHEQLKKLGFCFRTGVRSNGPLVTNPGTIKDGYKPLKEPITGGQSSHFGRVVRALVTTISNKMATISFKFGPIFKILVPKHISFPRPFFFILWSATWHVPTFTFFLKASLWVSMRCPKSTLPINYRAWINCPRNSRLVPIDWKSSYNVSFIPQNHLSTLFPKSLLILMVYSNIKINS